MVYKSFDTYAQVIYEHSNKKLNSDLDFLSLATAMWIDKGIEYNRALILSGIDYEKAFDEISLEAMKHCCIDYKYSSSIKT